MLVLAHCRCEETSVLAWRLIVGETYGAWDEALLCGSVYGVAGELPC